MEALRQKRAELQQRKEAATRRNFAEAAAECTVSDAVPNASSEWKVYRAKRLKQKLDAEDAGVDWEREAALGYSLHECQEWNDALAAKQEHAVAAVEDCGEHSAMALRSLVDTAKPHAASETELQRRCMRRRPKATGRRQPAAAAKTVGDYEDVTFINDVNRRFNTKVARFYDKYTREIAQSFERGTAV